MKICGIVGLKNSGKTFLAQKLITYFVKQKYKVASIKHAHHGFDIDKPNTDSFLHRKAGSEEVVVSSSKNGIYVYAGNKDMLIFIKNKHLAKEPENCRPARFVPKQKVDCCISELQKENRKVSTLN